MPKFFPALVVGEYQFPVVVLDESTSEGFQIYSEGGWLRRPARWILENTVLIGDEHVRGLLDELRGRGVELEKQAFLSEVTHES